MRRGFVGLEVMVLVVMLAGLVASLQLFKKDDLEFGASAVEDCETQGGSCYPNAWTCSGGILRSWPCGQGYKCYVGGSCHALTPTNTPRPAATNTPTPRPTNTPVPPTATPVPLILTLAEIETKADHVTLSMTANKSVGTFVIYRCAGANCTNLASFNSIGQLASGPTIFVDNSPRNNFYTYQVRVGTIRSNNVSVVVPPIKPVLTSTTTCPAQVNLTWDSLSGIGRYEIFRCDGGGCANNSYYYLTQRAGTIYGYADGLGSGNVDKGYAVRRYSSNTGLYGDYAYTGRLTRTCVIPSPTPIPAPSGLVVTSGPCSTTTNYISWQNIAGVTGYQIDRCNTATSACNVSNYVIVGNTLTGTVPFADNSASPNPSTYSYRVRANYGTSVYGAYAYATPMYRLCSGATPTPANQ